MADPKRLEKEEKYVRPTIGGWLLPTAIGPWVSIAVAVSLYAAFGPEHRFVSRWVVWGVGMLVGGLVSALFTLVQVLVDVLLLAIKTRRLPVGARGWLMSLAAPLPVLATWVLLPRDLYKLGPWAIVGAVLVPMLVSALGVRVFVGTRVERSAK
jgi:hypothetical protein